MLCVCPPDRVSVPEACAVCPIRSGLDTATATPVVVDDEDVGDPEESLWPQAATVANTRTINIRHIGPPGMWKRSAIEKCTLAHHSFGVAFDALHGFSSERVSYGVRTTA